MQLNLKTVLVNGEVPDPKVFTIGFGTWPKQFDSERDALEYIVFVYTGWEWKNKSILIQQATESTNTYVNASATLQDGYVITELWEIYPDETTV